MASASYAPAAPVIMTLSPGEASALLRVCQSIGGQPTNSRRGLLDQIGSALEQLGVGMGPEDTKGSIYFKEPDEME